MGLEQMSGLAGSNEVFCLQTVRSLIQSLSPELGTESPRTARRDTTVLITSNAIVPSTAFGWDRAPLSGLSAVQRNSEISTSETLSFGAGAPDIWPVFRVPRAAHLRQPDAVG